MSAGSRALPQAASKFSNPGSRLFTGAEENQGRGRKYLLDARFINANADLASHHLPACHLNMYLVDLGEDQGRLIEVL